MGRKKIDLAYIADDTVRKTTLRQRKKGLMKKLNELKVLCDVDACAVIYTPLNSNPLVWPSNLGVTNVIEKFEMLTEREKICRSVSHEGFLNKEIAKVKKKCRNLAEENKESHMRELMFKCLSGNTGSLSMQDDDLPDLCSFIDRYLENLVHHKNVTLKNPHFEIGESSSTAMARRSVAPHAMTAVVEPPLMAEEGFSSFLNAPQLTIELQSISLNERPEHVNSLASIPLPSRNQGVYIPVMNQDEVYYLNQNQQQEFVEEMMKLGEKTGFPWMEDNHQF